jgi:hypothetical protein
VLLEGTLALGAPELLTAKQRVYAVTGALILSWRDRPHVLYEIALFGAPPEFVSLASSREENFIRMLRAHERVQAATDGVGRLPNAVPSINAGMTDREYGEVYACVCQYVKVLAAKGAAWRKRKDSTI